MKLQFGVVFCILTTLSIFSEQGHCQTALKAAQLLEGTYTGEWKFYGLTKDLKIIRKGRGTDMIVLKDARQENGKAFCSETETLTADEGIVPFSFPPEVKLYEGYYVKPDGTAGDYFMQMNDYTINVSQLSPSNAAVSTPVSPLEFEILGLTMPNIKLATHGMTRVRFYKEDGRIALEELTRVTVVNWQDESGNNRSKQFVSFEATYQLQTIK